MTSIIANFVAFLVVAGIGAAVWGGASGLFASYWSRLMPIERINASQAAPTLIAGTFIGMVGQRLAGMLLEGVIPSELMVALACVGYFGVVAACAVGLCRRHALTGPEAFMLALLSTMSAGAALLGLGVALSAAAAA